MTSSHGEFAHLQIPLEKIKKATENFHEDNLIGEGTFGKVYSGSLLMAGESTKIAARRWHNEYGQGEFEFFKEIKVLNSGLKHRNLVTFVGYCHEEHEMIIIYNHESRRSLDKYLTDPALTWLQRLQICVDIAGALNYIHYDGEGERDTSFIHRNIKSSKILLDENWEPKLSGFELARENTSERRHRFVLAEVVGTIGYVDPTYVKTGFVTHKSDVYSFGVVLFEILCGREAFIQDPDEHSSELTAKSDHEEGFDQSAKSTILNEQEQEQEQRSPRIAKSNNEEGKALFLQSDYKEGKFDGNSPPMSGRALSDIYKELNSDAYGGSPPLSPDAVKRHHYRIDGPMLAPSFEPHPRRTNGSDGEPLSSRYTPNGGYSSNNIQARESTSYVERMPTSFANSQQSITSDQNVPVSAVYHRRPRYDDEYTIEKAPALSEMELSCKPAPKTAYSSFSSKTQDYAPPPLFSMKRLDQYKQAPNGKLLAQLAKSHFENETLDDIIEPALRKQMNQESFKIFTETAYNCLKEHRAERPNIDQILINLKKALGHQKGKTILEHPIVTGEVETTLSDRWEGKNLEHLKIPLKDIMLATKEFKQGFLGSGGYADVFRAELELSIEEKGEVTKKWRTVAIKRIVEDNGESGFIAEVELLSSCKHENIVTLLGFCDEGDEMILVYEHLSYGSLDSLLGTASNSTNLTWVQRINICIGIARGLNYLHTRGGEGDDEERIVHRDIKSANILLGKNWVAKIADFGLSRFHHNKDQAETIIIKEVAGTKPYTCPVYRENGTFKRAIDIYSFGVVLLEILSGKLAYDKLYTAKDKYGIAPVARRHFQEGIIHKMVEPKIMEEVDELTSTLHKGPNQDSLKTFLDIALRCVKINQNDRPTTNDILEELKKALSLQENNRDKLHMSFEELDSATDGFHAKNVIGRGGFGRVFKGEVRRGGKDITIVAKKMGSNTEAGQGELQFLTELEILFEYKHENIIGLEGYCNENNEKIIVYEHAPKSSLDKYLHEVSLEWTQRLKICIDVVRGLAFLHGHRGSDEAKEVVIHKDVKCANILLDANWKAKISDFGLSEITVVNKKSYGKVAGTHGYVDPEYEKTGFFTEKSDIYSLGVVLFEILHGQLLVPNTNHYNKKRVATTLDQIHEEGKLDLIVHFGIRKQISSESLSAFRIIASQCLNKDREKRPTAQEVLEQLNRALEFQEEYEIWGPKLPKDYEEIIQLSKSGEIYSSKTKKELYNLFCKGILLQDDKVKTDSEAASLHQEHTLPIMGPERLQEVGAYLTLDKMEEMVRPFAMPAEDFPPPSTPQGFSGYFKSAGVLERLLNLWPFHKHANGNNVHK